MKKIIAFIPVLFLYLCSKVFLFLNMTIIELSFDTYYPMGIFYMYLVSTIYMNMLKDWSCLKLFNV